MGAKYKQLTKIDRIFLGKMLEKGYSKSKIAVILKVHRSTIYREIKRNSFISSWTKNKVEYFALIAQKGYLKRRKRSIKLAQDRQLCSYVHEKLNYGWSEVDPKNETVV
ncbi:MAG: helix-turn-helix domain-containing protein [Gammaproteobacteria bacterium]|nr:helix-turn-helix domain-containing protein [Gammaproteobacteria bacterium]